MSFADYGFAVWETFYVTVLATAFSLVIGLPMTTAEYNADNPFAVAVGLAKGAKAGKASYVLCHQPKSFDWRIREAAPHPLKRLPDAKFAEVCAVLNQIVQLA